jgi:hypothetical protein
MSLLDLPAIQPVTGARIVKGIIHSTRNEDSTGNRPPYVRHPNAFCKRGHEMTKANTYVTSYGTRQCRECKAITDRAWRSARAMRESNQEQTI